MSLGNLTDIGVNLTNKRFADDCPEVLKRARAAGVSRCIITGTSLGASETAIRLCGRYRDEFPNMLFATAGVHPHEASTLNGETLGKIRRLAKENPGTVVAIGETGLDFFRNFSPPEVQIAAFEAQIELAADLNLPLFLHERDAHEDQFAILKGFGRDLPKGVIHCFTGDRKALEDYLELGLHIGITGWICDERRGRELQNLAADIPLDRVLVETDAPYLTPRSLNPRPANNRNEPAFLSEVVTTLAACRNESPGELARQTTGNAIRLFELA